MRFAFISSNQFSGHRLVFLRSDVFMSHIIINLVLRNDALMVKVTIRPQLLLSTFCQEDLETHCRAVS